MDDKMIMDTILGNVKGACDLMMHGSIESATQSVHTAFKAGLDDTLQMQNQIYNKMAQKGWYPMQAIDQTQIASTKQKYSSAN